MKHSSEFYKVVNAVINTLNHGDSVAYVSGGQGGSGFGLFSPDEDLRELRMHLIYDFTFIEELDADDDGLLDDWNGEECYDSSFDFYELSTSTSRLQLMINPDYYVNSYKLRDMISEDYDLECAEITEGINGYPRCLRGCVLFNDKDATFDNMERMAELYGVEVVSLRRKDGWHFWESQGKAFDLFDFQNILENSDDDALTFSSFKEYADFLFENANERRVADDEGAAHFFIEKAKEIEDKELGDNEFIHTSTYDISDYEVLECNVSNYSYDTWNYCLALDCAIFD